MERSSLVGTKMQEDRSRMPEHIMNCIKEIYMAKGGILDIDYITVIRLGTGLTMSQLWRPGATMEAKARWDKELRTRYINNRRGDVNCEWESQEEKEG